MSVVVDMLFNASLCEIGRIRDVLRNVGDVAVALDLVADIIVVFGSVLSSHRAEALDDYVIVHVCLNGHWLAAISVEVFFHNEFNLARLELIESVPQLDKEHFFTVLLKKIKVSVRRGQQNSSVDLKEVVEALVLVHLHAREDLLTDEPGLDLDLRRSVDQPWQVDGNGVTLVGRRIGNEVVWQELLICDVKTSIINCCVLVILTQVIIVVFEKVRLTVDGFESAER